jgi:hypothetical protein
MKGMKNEKIKIRKEIRSKSEKTEKENKMQKILLLWNLPAWQV